MTHSPYSSKHSPFPLHPYKQNLLKQRKAVSGTFPNPLNERDDPSWIHKNIRNPIAEVILGFRAGNTLFAAVSLGLFEFLSSRAKTAANISKGLNLQLETCEILLDALVSLGFLKKESTQYQLTRVSKNHLLKNADNSLYYNLRYQHGLVKAWSRLSETVRKGRSNKNLVEKISDPVFAKDYILGMKELAKVSAPEVGKILAGYSPQKLLDVGAGPAVYTKTILERLPTAQADLLDLPSSILVAKKNLEKIANRIKYIPADYRKVSFGFEIYDLVFLSHVTHDESETDNLKMLRNAHRALKVGGKIVIHDFTTNSAHTQPLFGALFSVHLMTYTKNGKTYSLEDYQKWIKRTGFSIKKITPISQGNANQTTLIIGQK